MSQELIEQFALLKSYKYNASIQTFISQNCPTDADIDEFLEITHALDNGYIPYKITTGFNIRLLQRRKR